VDNYQPGLEESKEEPEEFLYMAKHLQDTYGKDVFLLDGAATAHMVDSWVYLEGEREVNMTVQGLGKLQGVGKGNLVIQGLHCMSRRSFESTRFRNKPDLRGCFATKGLQYHISRQLEENFEQQSTTCGSSAGKRSFCLETSRGAPCKP
jgi:hypothetical protein